VPLTTIEAHTHLRLRFKGASRGRTWRIRVEASLRIDVYALPPIGMKDFEDGATRIATYEKSANRRHHEFDVRPDPGEPWYLVLVNNYNEEVSVFYEVLS
jgi:hypothetical protein